MRLLAVILVASLVPLEALAAEISSDERSLNGRNITVITIEGPLLSEDAFRFKDVARGIQGVAVLLNSPGGNLEAGIEIGRAISRAGYDTIVQDICASACALAWLAGQRRFAVEEAHIGFHVAYKGAAVPLESGMGNAVVGLYLGELGLGQNVVIYVTSAAPDDMQWLSFRDAALLGIDVTPLPSGALAGAIPAEEGEEPTLVKPKRVRTLTLDARFEEKARKAIEQAEKEREIRLRAEKVTTP